MGQKTYTVNPLFVSVKNHCVTGFFSKGFETINTLCFYLDHHYYSSISNKCKRFFQRFMNLKKKIF